MSAAVSYARYLQLDALLASASPLTADTDPEIRNAERYFIVIHQSSELLVSQALDDMATACRIAAADSRELERVACLLERIASVLLSLCRLIDQLGAFLPDTDFLAFRPLLMGASGAESRQFGELMRIAGGTHPDIDRIRVACAGTGASFAAIDRRIGLVIATAQLWQCIHLAVVRRMIGQRRGTGDTEGAAFLETRVELSPTLRALIEAVAPGIAVGAFPADAARQIIGHVESDLHELRMR
ncbi:MAG: tryptophan 2,3-dioxygenase family protein [Pseudomonadota bacterium]